MVHMLLSRALMIGALFVYASFFEWTPYRFVMHRVFLISYPFRTHTLIHHRDLRNDSSYHLGPNESHESLTFAWWNAPLLIGLHVPLRIRRHFEWEREEGSLCPADDPSGHRA